MNNHKILSVAALFASVLCAPSYSMDLSLGDAVSRIVDASHDMRKADANLKKA